VDRPVAGETSAPPIVLVHGTRLSAAQWQPQIKRLRRRFPVAAVDLPGHGSARHLPWSLDAAVDAVAAALPPRPGEAVVVGHSLGGYVAAMTAELFPERMAGLVLMGCSRRPRGATSRLYHAAATVVERIPERWLTTWNTRLFRRMWPPDVVDPVIAAGYGFAALPAAWRSILAAPDVLATLRTFERPILVLNGEKDRVFRRDELWVVANSPRAHLRLVPHAGHLAGFDRPDEVSDVIGDFARAVASGGRRSR